ncbi:D-alanyl-D-alanine endopeptidase [Thiobacter aerophilum]|uniref:D-alanyl-D-alanine endopeptidase n=1 Tax=Thiobacter aerophilum TaxID=3121275 RepID=A0ABV0EJ41_9BURK
MQPIFAALCLSLVSAAAGADPCAVPSPAGAAPCAAAVREEPDPIAVRIRQYETELTERLRGDPELRSSMALVMDERTGRVIYAKNPDVRTPIASITKLMTAMVTLDAGLPLDQKITISDDDVDRVKGTHSRLAVGTVLTRYQLLQLALMSSENRAAAALARTYPGGTAAFVAAMNRKAQRLGMRDTSFVDSTGLRPGNQSTAEDLAKMVKAAHAYPTISEITTTASYDIEVPVYKRHKALARGGVLHRSIAYRNTNKLVSDKEWEIGLSKTGYIAEAGHCLVMQAQIANQPLIIVLLDGDGKFTRITDANRIKRWLESSFASIRHDG